VSGSHAVGRLRVWGGGGGGGGGGATERGRAAAAVAHKAPFTGRRLPSRLALLVVLHLREGPRLKLG
jgi:hypothetical protein